MNNILLSENLDKLLFYLSNQTKPINTVEFGNHCATLDSTKPIYYIDKLFYDGYIMMIGDELNIILSPKGKTFLSARGYCGEEAKRVKKKRRENLKLVIVILSAAIALGTLIYSFVDSYMQNKIYENRFQNIERQLKGNK